LSELHLATARLKALTRRFVLALLRNTASHAQGLEGSQTSPRRPKLPILPHRLKLREATSGKPLYKMAALPVASRRLPGMTQRSVCPSRLFRGGGYNRPIDLPNLETFPGAACLPTHRTARLQSGSPPGVRPLHPRRGCPKQIRLSMTAVIEEWLRPEAA
jgi:hypothetical protein